MAVVALACTACLSPVDGPPQEVFCEPIFGRKFDIFRCPHCGVTFSVIPDNFPIKEWYSKADHLYGEEEWIIHVSPKADWRFRYFFVAAKRLNLKGDILDVGSGDGRFLMRASQEGWHGSLNGLEFNPDMVRRREGPYKVYIASLQEFAEQHGSLRYDVVTLFDVLEHLPEPAKAMDLIINFIKPGGHLAVTVPNEERLHFMQRETFDFPPNHNTRWTSTALASLVRRAGLDIIEVRASPFSVSLITDKFFYKFFWGAMPLVKRLLFGPKAVSGKTLTALLSEETAAKSRPPEGLKSLIATKSQRRKLEAVSKKIFAVLLWPFLLPVTATLRAMPPRRKGACLFLLARRP